MKLAMSQSGPTRRLRQRNGMAAIGAKGFTASNRERRQEWMLDPEARGT
jgi:hypothetical protein